MASVVSIQRGAGGGEQQRNGETEQLVPDDSRLTPALMHVMQYLWILNRTERNKRSVPMGRYSDLSTVLSVFYLASFCQMSVAALVCQQSGN